MQEDFHASGEKFPADGAKEPLSERSEKGAEGNSAAGEVPTGESFIDFVRFAILAAAIVIPIRLFVAQPFIVSGSSMIPSYTDGNYLIIDEITYRWNDPERGDVIVFRFPPEPSKYLIKRVAALPGETIEIRGDTVTIFNTEHPQGFVWTQGEIESSANDAEQKVELERDEYFVLGDNRDESADSRIWGPLKREFVTGRPPIRLLPVTDFGLLPGKWQSQD